MNNSTTSYHKPTEAPSQDRMTSLIVVLALGLGIGAIIALLFAPEKGEKVREQLGKELERTSDQVEKQAGKQFKQWGRELDRATDQFEKDASKRLRHFEKDAGDQLEHLQKQLNEFRKDLEERIR